MILPMHGPDSMGFRWLDLQISQFSGLQDKSADHSRAYVVGWIRLFAYWSNRTRWRLSHKVQGIQCSESHPLRFRRLLLQ